MQLLAGEKRSRVALVTGSMRAIGTATGRCRGRGRQLCRLAPDEAARAVHLLCADVCCVICGQVWALNFGGEA
jgi:hypothetical protein